MLFLDIRLSYLAFALLFGSLTVNAEEECLFQTVQCYDCESTTDPRCADPFNTSVSHVDQPKLLPCQGCCVKIVGKVGTPNETVRRTCTTSLQINLFLVDHVCMLESRGAGHMCFCESDGCNSAPRSINDAVLVTVGLLFLYACLKLPLYYVD